MSAMSQEQAVSVILEYDVLPKSSLTREQSATLTKAKELNRNYAYRATSEFLNHESSKKYLGNSDTKVVTLNEHHD